MKINKKYYKSADPFFKKLMNDPEVRFHYEENKAKSKLAMAVKTARLRAHLSQAKLAEKIGTTQSVIARLESGTDQRTPTLPLLAHIATACGGNLEIGFKFKHAI
jgi:ribosome-binding protein aMBF1 (putative translation factor)